jgi:predicted PurR-regulated permease PerM
MNDKNISNTSPVESFFSKLHLEFFNAVCIIIVFFIFIFFNFEYKTSLLSGFILAILSYPFYKSLNKIKIKKISIFNNSISGILTIIIIGLLIYLISQYFISNLVNEIPKITNDLIKYFQNDSKFSNLVYNLLSFFKITNPDDYITNLIQSTQSGIQDSVNKFLTIESVPTAIGFSQQFLTGVISQLINFILFILAWFNGLVVGDKWIKAILNLTPLEEDEIKIIHKSLSSGIRNVIYANSLSGVINATVVMLIMIFFNLPGVFLAGVVTFFIGFLPIFPSELGYLIPIIQILIILNNPLLALLIAVISEVFILFQNYVFLPSIVLIGNSGNSLFIVTSVLTGIAVFGIMGFIIGPAIMIFANTMSQVVIKRINKNKLHETY